MLWLLFSPPEQIIEAIIQSQINSEALSLIQDELATLLDSARAKYPTCPKADTSEMSKTGTTSIVWGVISGTLCVSGFLCILLGYFAMMRQQEVIDLAIDSDCPVFLF